MGFASAWLKTGTVFPEFIKEAPHEDTGIIIVVPAFDEPEITKLLDSLSACGEPQCKTEVIININAPLGATSESLINNSITQDNIKSWEKMNSSHFFRLYFFNTGQPDIKKWGVGLARKSLMDEALRRYDFLDKQEGVIACLDADCTVQGNYFLSLERDLLNKPARRGCSVYFEHLTEGKEFDPGIYHSIIQYELHLRYYRHALSYSGFPHLFYTVGSSIAVKALPYVKAGGMNRRQAGEDFYFVQKLIPSGGYFSLNSTTVYPSPRKSERVPFGTGMTIGKLSSEAGGIFLTYNILAFKDLKSLFDRIEVSYELDEHGLGLLFRDFPPSVRSFIGEAEWIKNISEIKGNTSGYPSFRKRFFQWFNMFAVVKYLNKTHTEGINKIPVEKAAKELLAVNGISEIPQNASDLLGYFRQADRNS